MRDTEYHERYGFRHSSRWSRSRGLRGGLRRGQGRREHGAADHQPGQHRPHELQSGHRGIGQGTARTRGRCTRRRNGQGHRCHRHPVPHDKHQQGPRHALPPGAGRQEGLQPGDEAATGGTGEPGAAPGRGERPDDGRRPRPGRPYRQRAGIPLRRRHPDHRHLPARHPHFGDWTTTGGRMGELSADDLSPSIEETGLELGRLKTDTPPRVNYKSLNLGGLEEQHGDPDPPTFSFATDSIDREQLPCYMTATNPETHEIIRDGLDRAPLYDGQITSTGPRYCPSIEIKVVRFPDKDHHILFLEPEGRNTLEVYCNGLFTSLPQDVQEDMIHSIEGMEDAQIMRYGYAVEYDFVPPTQLWPSLETKKVDGLFCAGQINGTSGYEEAAGQGIMAGINAARKLQEKEPIVLGRDEAYIGVMIDDLVTKGVMEPYRMFTSLAEYRLMLRQDNADRRLMQYGYENGLIPEKQWRRLQQKERDIEELREYLQEHRHEGKTLEKYLRQPEMDLQKVAEIDPHVLEITDDPEAREQVEIVTKYEGYLKRQRKQIEKFRRQENKKIPDWVDYDNIPELRREAREKLSDVQPKSRGQASRISGISPADVSILMIYLEGRRDEDAEQEKQPQTQEGGRT
ncbi:MAG: tRNA uridine-5-carboxymethylaminomethyl(34) synthesis enzyme MnmG [Planctomycetota bacterium]